MHLAFSKVCSVRKVCRLAMHFPKTILSPVIWYVISQSNGFFFNHSLSQVYYEPMKSLEGNGKLLNSFCASFFQILDADHWFLSLDKSAVLFWNVKQCMNHQVFVWTKETWFKNKVSFCNILVHGCIVFSFKNTGSSEILIQFYISHLKFAVFAEDRKWFFCFPVSWNIA